VSEGLGVVAEDDALAVDLKGEVGRDSEAEGLEEAFDVGDAEATPFFLCGIVGGEVGGVCW